MKKMILSGCIALGSFFAHAQFFNYNTATGWGPNIRNTYSTTGCTGGAPVTTPYGAVPAGSILVNTTSTRVEYTTVRGAHENRIAFPLGNAYDQLYNLDFDFNIADDPANFAGRGVFMAVLSSQNRNPVYDIPMTVCAAAPVMDVLGIHCISNANTDAGLRAKVDVWDEGVLVAGNTAAEIFFNHGTTYYARVEVYNNGMGTLSLFSDTSRTVLVGSVCFNMPSTVNQLSWLQHATFSGGGTGRNTNGWVDNTFIYNRGDEDCCQIRITGDNVVCDHGHMSETYSVVTNGTNPSISVSPAGITYTDNGNGSITVNNWNLTSSDAPKVVTLTAHSICKCEEITATMTVYIYPPLDASFVLSSTAGTNITALSGTSTLGSAGVLHTWELYNSNSGGAALSLARPVYTSTGVGSTYVVNTTVPGVLPASNYYMMRHTMTFASGLCGPAVTERMFIPGTKMGLLDLGAPGELSETEIAQRISDAENGLSDPNAVRVSPNPTTGKVLVESAIDMLEVVLTDANGRTIETLGKSAKAITFDLSALDKGTYFIKVVTANGSQLERVIRQ